MNAELPDRAGPGPRRRFTIRILMLAVAAVALTLAWFVGQARANRRFEAASTRIDAVTRRIIQDNPSLYHGVNAYQSVVETFGGNLLNDEYHLRTASFHEITIGVEARSGIFRDGPSRVTFESMGRSVAWPLEDLERGREVDLRSMFPEAFR